MSISMSLRSLSVLTLLMVVMLVAEHVHHAPGPELELTGIVSSATAWERYWMWLKVTRERRPRTIANYHRTLWTFWGFIDPKPWHRTGPRDLQRFIDRQVQCGHRKGQRLAANTRLIYAAPVCGFYRWCAEQGILSRDRMLGFTLPKGGRPVARAVGTAELRSALLAAESDPRLSLMLWLGYGAGLRAAEIAALRIEHCNLAERGSVFVVDGKGGRDRVVPLHPSLRAALVRWVSQLPQAGPLFESPVRRGQPIGYKRVSTLITTHLHQLGIDASAHALRHSFATELLRAAGEQHLLTVSRILGHATTKETEKVYLLAYQGDPAVVARLPDPLDHGEVTS